MTGNGSLLTLIRKLMYVAVLENLMGENILPLTSKVCLIFFCFILVNIFIIVKID